MTPLQQAAAERYNDFKVKISAYKKSNGLTWFDIGEECELYGGKARRFVTSDRVGNFDTALKISMALGIEI